MPIMKTLNGYEVVDAKARQDIANIVVPTKVSQLENDKAYLTSIPAEYITETELNNKGYITEHQSLDNYYTKAQTDSAIGEAISGIQIPEVDLSPYAKVADIPTKVSQLENDANYLTQHQSLDGYATEQYVNNKVSEIDLTSYATKQELTAVENKIPSLTGYATEAYVDGKIAEIPGTDLSNYYNKTETDSAISTAIAGITIPTKVSELENDSNFVTETELDQKGYLTEHQSLADYATKTYVDGKIADIPSIEGSKVYHFDFSSFTANSPQAATAEMIEFAESTLAGKHSCAYVRIDSGSLAFSPTKVAVDSSSVFLYNCYSGRASWSAETTASIAFYKFNDSWMANVTDKVNHRLATTTYVNDAIAGINIPNVEPSTFFLDFSTATSIDQAATEAMIEFANYFKNNDNVSVYMRDSFDSDYYYPAVIQKANTYTFNFLKASINLNTVVADGTLNWDVIRIYSNDNGVTWKYTKLGTRSTTIATKTYVDDAIANAGSGGGGAADLSNYYTKQETDTAISTAIAGLNIPDVSKYQTADQVTALINNALAGIATAEGGSY